MIVNKSMYPVSRDLKSIATMQRQFENLQLQFATGKRYNTLAEMGGDRVHDINLRARLSRIEGFQANILTVETRMGFYTNSLQRLDEIEASARALAVPGAYGTDGINFANARNQATNLMKEVIDVLNTDITGQYIFSGSHSDKKPVASFDEIMAGFRTAVDAHLDTHNSDEQGMVTVSDGGPGLVTLTSLAAAPGEPEVGIRIAGGATTVDLSGVTEDQTITISYSLPNDPAGKVRTLDMRAVAQGTDPLPANGFEVVRDADGNVDAVATAQAFEERVTGSLETIAKTDLRSVVTYMAADDFFHANDAPADGSFSWYRGENSNNPRQTVSANVDEHTRAHYGVQANEAGFVELIKSLAVFAVSDDMAGLDDINAARYEEFVSIARGRLSDEHNSKPGSIELITMELGLAASTIDTVNKRHTQYNAQLETMLGDIAAAPREEVAMMLLTLQTQLQASYQVTAMASQLSLVNYLR